MKNITIADCLKLRERFIDFANKQEQHMFPVLAVINEMMDKTIASIEKDGEVKNQKDINSMFRVVLKFMGEDFSAYEEELNE